MAYTDEQKTAFATRLSAVKERLAERGVKYYGPAARALDPSADAKRLNNVMNGLQQHEPSLLLLERLVGIECPAEIAA